MVVDRIRLAGALSSIVAGASSQVDLPERLCDACLSVLPVDGVGLSVMSSNTGGRVLLGATDEIGSRIEELQFGLGEGPCMTAFSEGRPVLVPDLEDIEARTDWPVFTQEVLATGVRSLFAFPLRVGTIRIGVLDCHSREPGPLAEINEALIVADAVTMALLNFQSRDEYGVETDLFDVSWRSHTTVHQATGMVSSQLDVKPDEALVRLRGYAFRHERSLEDIAADIVGRKLRLTGEDM